MDDHHLELLGVWLWFCHISKFVLCSFRGFNHLIKMIPLPLQWLRFSDDVFTGVRMGQFVTQMRLTNGKPQPSKNVSKFSSALLFLLKLFLKLRCHCRWEMTTITSGLWIMKKTLLNKLWLKWVLITIQ